MKIVFVSDAIYPYNKGGKEKRLYELSTRLAAMGHDVHIYCMKWWDGSEKSRTEEGVHLHALSKLYPLYAGERRSIKQGIMFGLSTLKLWRVKFDVIDVDHMPFFPIFGIWIATLGRHRKFYGTWHEALKLSDWTSYMGKAGHIAALIERISIKLPHAITVSSHHTATLIKSELKRNKRLSVISPGIDIKAINKIKPAKFNYDILFVGRLVKHKNANMLIRAVAILAKQNSKIQCAIIGTGVEQANLEKLIKKLGLESNVHLLGNLPYASDIYAYMKAAKVFALPSAREGFGIVVLEALACGTPAVTINTAANASKWLISENISGSVTEPTPVALATAIKEWLQKDIKRSNLSMLAAHYDWQALAERQAQVYTA